MNLEPAGRHRAAAVTGGFVAAALLAALVLGGCATTPKGDRATDPGALQAQAARLIEAASPRDLGQAATILSAPVLDGAARAEALASLASDVFRKLYPEASSPFPPPRPAAVQQAVNQSAFYLVVTPCFTLLEPGGTLTETAASDLKARLVSADGVNHDSVLPPYLQGILVQRQGGDPAVARALYEESLRRGPDFYPAGVKIAQIIIQGETGREDAAAAELPLLRRLAGLLPTPTLRFAALARAELAAGQPQAAADAAAQGLLLAPEDPGFFLLRAQAMEALGNWYQALSLLDTLLKLKPDQPQAVLMKARLLYEKQQKVEQAMALLLDAESRFPSDASFPELQGRILLETGRGDDGVAALVAALAVQPGRVSTLVLLLRHDIQAGNWARASQLLLQIPEKALTPDLLRQAWEVQTNLGDYSRAALSARSLERVEPGAAAMALEARSLVAEGQVEQAMGVVTRALAEADTPALRSELLYLRSTAGSDDPMRDLRSALMEEPHNLEALIAISDLLAQQQDWRKAAAYAREASELSPQNAGLAQKAADLQKRADSSGN